MAKTLKLKQPGFFQGLETEYKGKKVGTWAAFGAALITILCWIPAIKWVQVINAPNLFDAIGVSSENAALLKSGYTPFDLLSFVQHSRMGILGLYSMILLLLAIVSVYFQVLFAGKVILNRKGKNGNLSLYVTAQVGFIFTLITIAALMGFVIFANGKFGQRGFGLSPLVYVLLIINLLAYLVIKKLESNERKLYHEHGFLEELKRNWVLFLMLVPTFIYFMINNYLPMVGVYYAFTSFNFRDGLWASPFIGFQNFEFLLKADLFRLTRNTVMYNLVFIILGNVLQIVFAVFVSQVAVKWFKKISQTLMFMPYFVSFVILKVLVYNLLEYNVGLVNTIVTAFGGEKIDFYNNPSFWPWLITAFYIWKNIGYGMVVYLATIMGIDTEYYDAAKVDGANIFQQIRYITMPLLKPTFIILLLYALGSIMKGQFEMFYQLVGTNGVLYNVTDIFDTYVYRITMTQPLSIGLGTAAGLYQSVFGFLVIMITNWLVKRRNPEHALF